MKWWGSQHLEGLTLPGKRTPRINVKAPTLGQFCLYWLPPLLVTAGILLFSGEWGSSRYTLKLLGWLRSWLPLMGPSRMEEANFYLRKAGHALAYATLYVLWFRALRGYFFPRLGPAIFLSLFFCLSTSIADEGHQSFVPSRGGSLWDVSLDFGAAVLAALALYFKSR